jgi:hypothetical protein
MKLYYTLYFILLCLSGFSQSRPNVVLIITNDQGYGDLGVTGNPHVQTPTLDQLARESIQLTNFYLFSGRQQLLQPSALAQRRAAGLPGLLF